tara:strand:- start:109111 stop:109944 length:834 start_codon:yes stop_codon:yes gene_type:complete
MKNHFRTIFLSLCTLSAPYVAHSQCVTDSNNIYAFTYNGDNYEIIKENLNWVDAANCALTRGGFLAEINSQQEQDSIFYYVNRAGISASSTVAPDGGGASYLWIGGNDLATEGKWVWDGNNDAHSVQFWQGTKTGNAVGGLYNNWGNEPDDFGGQDALGLAFTDWPLGVAGQWNDVNHTNTLFYLIEYNTTTGISSLNKELGIHVFPNPGNDHINIQIPVTSGFLKLYNLQGELMKMVSVQNTITLINTSKLPTGLYFLHWDSNTYTSKTVKVVVQH